MKILIFCLLAISCYAETITLASGVDPAIWTASIDAQFSCNGSVGNAVPITATGAVIPGTSYVSCHNVASLPPPPAFSQLIFDVGVYFGGYNKLVTNATLELFSQDQIKVYHATQTGPNTYVFPDAFFSGSPIGLIEITELQTGNEAFGVDYRFTADVTTVPEPATLWMLLTGVIALGLRWKPCRQLRG